MPWNPPKTWTTNELVTAEMMNSQVRDNFLYLKDRSVARAFVNSLTAVTTSHTAYSTISTSLRITVTPSVSTGNSNFLIGFGGHAFMTHPAVPYQLNGGSFIAVAIDGAISTNLTLNTSFVNPNTTVAFSWTNIVPLAGGAPRTLELRWMLEVANHELRSRNRWYIWASEIS
jgi:hypothetical protein